MKLNKEAEESGDEQLNLALMAPNIVEIRTGVYAVFCEQHQICSDIETLEEAAAVMMSLFYATNVSFPKRRQRTLEFLAFLCGVEDGQQSVVTAKAIQFIKLYMALTPGG
jgi:hypothetical protein